MSTVPMDVLMDAELDHRLNPQEQRCWLPTAAWRLNGRLLVEDGVVWLGKVVRIGTWKETGHPIWARMGLQQLVLDHPRMVRGGSGTNSRSTSRPMIELL